jgi:hypothetical protein
MSLRPKPSIGDVRVFRGEPEHGAYATESICGEERAAALRALRDGGDTDALSFWCAPFGGGAYRIESPEQIDWRSMS